MSLIIYIKVFNEKKLYHQYLQKMDVKKISTTKEHNKYHTVPT